MKAGRSEKRASGKRESSPQNLCDPGGLCARLPCLPSSPVKASRVISGPEFFSSPSHRGSRGGQNKKITKRTHFVILNYFITTTVYPRRVRNRHKKRTHFVGRACLHISSRPNHPTMLHARLLHSAFFLLHCLSVVPSRAGVVRHSAKPPIQKSINPEIPPSSLPCAEPSVPLPSAA
jgi:hypothetical protein